MKRCLFLCNSMSPFSRKKVYGGEVVRSDTADQHGAQDGEGQARQLCEPARLHCLSPCMIAYECLSCHRSAYPNRVSSTISPKGHHLPSAGPVTAHWPHTP